MRAFVLGAVRTHVARAVRTYVLTDITTHVPRAVRTYVPRAVRTYVLTDITTVTLFFSTLLSSRSTPNYICGTVILMSVNACLFLLQSSFADQRWLTDATAVFDPKPIVQPQGGIWVHAILLSCFTLLVLLRVYDFRRISMLVQGFVRPAAVATLYREESALTSRVSFFLILNFIMVCSLFLWQSMASNSSAQVNDSVVVWIALALFGVYVVKIISTRLLGFIFEVKEAAREYAYNIVLFNKTIGLILFPITLLLTYARQVPAGWLIWSGLVLWGLALLYRLVRLSFIGFSVRGVSIFYIILYLCTLEILPVLVIIKLLIKQH